ncbi:MAG: PDZ domain-containing protein [Thermoanaerobaculia bacterium]
MNLRGEVVGINTAINWGSENIGFAVPVNILDQVLPQLRETGRVRRGFLGIGVNDVAPRVAEAFGLESTDGVLVTGVQPGLPADKSGVRHGDIILKIDGQVVKNTRDLIDYVSTQGPDKTVEMELLRNGEILTKQVVLSERPSEGVESESTRGPEESGIEWLGLRYQDLTPGLRSMHGLPEDLEGVWITEISPRSPLYDEGLRAGGNVLNVIIEVNGIKVESVAEFERVVRDAESGSRLRIYVRRFAGGQEGQPVFVFPAVP